MVPFCHWSIDEEVACLEAEEARHWEEERKALEEAKRQEQEEKWWEEEWKEEQEAEEEQRKQEEVEEEWRKEQEEEAWVALIVKHADEVHCHHAEKKWLKQVEMMRKEEFWGKAGGEIRGESRMWRCNYCTKKNTACHWPSTGSKAHLCSQCREHKVTCVVGGEVNKKRKEWGSPKSVVQKKTKTVEMVEMAAWSSSSKDVTLVGLNINQQLILELQVIHHTLCAIDTTLKDVLLQINPDWSEKEKKESSSEEEEEEKLEKELEEKGEENLVEEMTLDDEVMELGEEAKEKANEN